MGFAQIAKEATTRNTTMALFWGFLPSCERGTRGRWFWVLLTTTFICGGIAMPIILFTLTQETSRTAVSVATVACLVTSAYASIELWAHDGTGHKWLVPLGASLYFLFAAVVFGMLSWAGASQASLILFQCFLLPFLMIALYSYRKNVFPCCFPESEETSPKYRPIWSDDFEDDWDHDDRRRLRVSTSLKV